MEENKDKKVEEKVEEKEGLTLGMDNKNKEAFNIFLKEGNDAFIKHVFKGEGGGQLSYAEMRMMYG